MQFRVSDSPPRRAEQLGAMHAELCAHDKRLTALEHGEVYSPPVPGEPTEPGDPGDMTLWFENQLI
jgi:hypothetical protein